MNQHYYNPPYYNAQQVGPLDPRTSASAPRDPFHDHFAFQGMIYQIGGQNERSGPLADVTRFEPRSKLWIPCSPMSTPRIDFGAAIHNNNLYVAGGETVSSQILSSAEKFDIYTDTWSPLPSMNTRRKAIGSTTVFEKFYVCG